MMQAGIYKMPVTQNGRGDTLSHPFSNLLNSPNQYFAIEQDSSCESKKLVYTALKACDKSEIMSSKCSVPA